MENIVYLLIGIAWFFWNAYRKSKEEDSNKTPVPKSSKPRRFEEAKEEPLAEPFKSLEDLIMEQIEGKKKPEPVPIKVEPEQHHNQDKFLNLDLDHSHLPPDYKMSESEKGSHRVQRQVERNVQVEEREETLADQLFPEGFDLRKAVVLNAILERPYG
jgi:hypothetical protein